MTTDKTTTKRSIREAWDALDAATTAAFAAAKAPSFTATMIAQAVNPARRALDAAIRADERGRFLDEIAALKTEANTAEKRAADAEHDRNAIRELLRLVSEDEWRRFDDDVRARVAAALNSGTQTAPCTVCGQSTEWACSDCRIDTGRSVHVCNSKICRDKHETTTCTAPRCTCGDNHNFHFDGCTKEPK
jgi:hypothetical protein